MNIYVFNEGAWDNKRSFGNTISNWLTGEVWKNDHFLNFYTRFQIPDNDVDVNYLRLTAVDVIKGLLKCRMTGLSFTSSDIPKLKDSMGSSAVDEQRRIDRIHGNNNQLIYLAYELIWISRFWICKQFKDFIRKEKPDVMFAFAGSPALLWPMIQYLKKKTQCKIVLFISDDMYGSYDDLPFYRRFYLKPMLEKCILKADKLYAVSDEMSLLYQNRFGKQVSTLYKGCDLSKKPKNYINSPIRFVYAGNLLWGRDDILTLVADALEKINQDGVKATLEIYTGATVTPELDTKLNRGKSSKIMGSRRYDEVKQIMHDADVVLHVESFDHKTIEMVQYSFSTKIIDCLQSGNQVMGIGPKRIASIEYLRKVEGAIVLDSEELIEEGIQLLVKDRAAILSNAQKTRKYASEKHEIISVQEKLRTELQRVCLGTDDEK